MNLPIRWIKDENGNVIGYQKWTAEEIIAQKETELLKVYEEIQKLKATQNTTTEE